GAAAAAFASGQMDGVAVFAPFTTQALKRPGSRALFTSKEFPGSIPDHLVVNGALLKERPQDVQKLVNAWFMTVDYIKSKPQDALKIMAKRAGVPEAEYKEYDAGTTIFSVAENKTAFQSGNDMSRLNFAAQEIGKFLLDNKFIEKPLDASKLFDSRFVDAYAPQKK
ncbi:MAG: ABC transporter substrate-binding protein, partial [Chloroflexota bacterium]